jgi:DNA-binding response OmpR family regulator
LYYGAAPRLPEAFRYTPTRLMAKAASRLVLVVEDDTSVRGPLVKFLEMYGFDVVTAETGLQGVEVARKQQIVAAVIDLRLHQGSGHDVVAAIPPEIPIIIFSGVPSESAELERTRPHTRLIEKPSSLVLLVQSLEEMLADAVADSENLHS